MTVWAWLWIALVPFALAVALFVWRFYGIRKLKWTRYMDRTEVLFMFGVVTTLVGMVASTILFCYTFGGAYAGRQCNRYGEATGVSTTFIRWSFWTWDCYVDTDKGKITLGQYRAIEQVDRD